MRNHILRHDHDWTRGKVQLGSAVEQQPHGKVVLRSRGEVEHAAFSRLTQPIPKPISDRSRQLDGTQSDDRTGQPDGTQGVFVVEGETPVSIFTKDSVSQIDQGNLMVCLKHAC